MELVTTQEMCDSQVAIHSLILQNFYIFLLISAMAVHAEKRGHYAGSIDTSESVGGMHAMTACMALQAWSLCYINK